MTEHQGSKAAAETTTREQTHAKLLHAATTHICRGKPPQSWTDDEAAAMRIIAQIAGLYQFHPDASAVQAIRKALAMLEKPDTLQARRAHCVDVVAEWGEKWHHPEWQASDDTRALLIKQAIDELTFWEPEFVWLQQYPDALTSRLDEYSSSPAGRPGAKGAERILAELIAVEGDALGLAPREDESEEDAVERVRKKLVSDRRKVGW